LKPGVETFAMLLAITSIARYVASCWERLTRSEFSIGLPDPFWSVVPSVLQPPCHREMPGFVGFPAGRAQCTEILAGLKPPYPAI
jgi:hypothetical protein